MTAPKSNLNSNNHRDRGCGWFRGILWLRVAAGTYDVVVKSVELRNGGEQRFENVVVNGGERAYLEHEFASGIIKIGTSRGAVLVDSVVAGETTSILIDLDQPLIPAP